MTVVGRAAASAQFTSVFVSSTIGDLKTYRRALRDTLGRIPLNCFLSEELASGYANAVEKCKREIAQSGGYVGIFGYWYGSIPTEAEVSITHLEFRWALERWKDEPEPPMAIFMPEEPKSTAKKDLQQKALDILKTNYGDEEERRKKHDALLSAFHNEVTGGWRWVKRFKDRRDLRELAGITCAQWKGLTPLAVSRGEAEVVEKVAAGRKPTDEELGLLGRKPQLDAVEDILNVIKGRAEVPAVAMLVGGNEDVGQRQLLMQLGKRLKSGGRPPLFGRPPTKTFDAVTLAQWVGQIVPGGQEVSTVEELADALHAGLLQQQLCAVVEQVNLLVGGVVAFRNNFWEPLYKRLKELRRQQPTQHRLVIIAADYTGRADLYAQAAAPYDPEESPADYSTPLALPPLKQITPNHLLNWFGALGIEDSPPGRLASLVEQALTNPSGENDGTPLRVFNRLQGLNLWPEGGAG